MGISLRLLGYATTLFDDGSYRWIYSKRYRLLGTATADVEVLELLLADPSYQFVSPVPGGEASGHSWGPTGAGVHGPYRIECLTPECFQPVEPGYCADYLLEWAAEDSSVPRQIEDELDDVRAKAARATACFVSGEMDPSSVVEASYLGPWAEVVIVDRLRGEVALMVASSD